MITKKKYMRPEMETVIVECLDVLTVSNMGSGQAFGVKGNYDFNSWLE